MSSQETAAEDAAQAGMARAIAYGCINLNAAFVERQRPVRIFKNQALRLSVPEMVWIVISTLVYMGIIALIVLAGSSVPVLRDLISWLMLILAPILGWPTGRAIARTSPYRSHSGEGLGEFLWVQSDKAGALIGRLFGGRQIVMSEEYTRVSGKELKVECIEWIGTARAMVMPRHSVSRNNTSIDVLLVPSSVPTNWVDEVARRKRIAATNTERAIAAERRRASVVEPTRPNKKSRKSKKKGRA